MNTEQALSTLKRNREMLFALDHAASILGIDGETVAPSGSAATRTRTMGELTRMIYDLVTDREASAALEFLYDHRDELGPVDARNVSELYRDLNDARKISKEEEAAFVMLLLS